MLKNCLKIGLRNLVKHKGHDIAGLAVDMACCYLILLYVRHELNHDRFHEKAGHIHLQQGEARAALQDPHAIILGPYAALKYSGKEDPMGKTLTAELGNREFTVTGVLAQIPSNSHLQPLVDIHLHSNFDDRTGEMGNLTYLCLFSALAFFVLILACSNFMNLTTARSHQRAKEVGVSKAAGSARLHRFWPWRNSPFPCVLRTTSYA
jgi:hypothetical protein